MGASALWHTLLSYMQYRQDMQMVTTHSDSTQKIPGICAAVQDVNQANHTLKLASDGFTC